MKNLLFVILMLIPFSCWSEIYKATGTAPIINQNIGEARNKAIQDALRQALMQSGASITTEQSSKNGRLTMQNIRVTSDSKVRRYSILEQKNHGDYLEVTISADIQSKNGVCNGKNHAKSITALRFFYDEGQLQQSQLQLHGINRELTRQMYSRLMQNREIFNTSPWLDQNYRFDMRSLNNPDLNVRRQIKHLAKSTDSQYLIIGSIRDLGFSGKNGNIITKWFKNDNRSISFSIYLLDGYTGDLLLAKNFSGKAEWEFDQEDHVDVRSDVFWDSAYGQKITELLNSAVAEISKEIMCKPLYATILRAENNHYYINAGSSNKLKKGDTFRFALSNNYYDRNRNERQSNTAIPGTFVVAEVFANDSLLIPQGKTLPDSNIQIGDLAISN